MKPHVLEIPNTFYPDIVWKTVPLHPPFVSRSCTTCEKNRRFYCSGKFRINSQQKKVDVWLIYKYSLCNATWNCRILHQANPRTISSELFQKFQSNDQLIIWKYAFNNELFRKNKVIPDFNIDYILEGENIDFSVLTKQEISVLLISEYQSELRLDMLLAKKMEIPRKYLASLLATGSIAINRKNNSPRQKLKEELQIVMKACDLKAYHNSSNPEIVGPCA